MYDTTLSYAALFFVSEGLDELIDLWSLVASASLVSSNKNKLPKAYFFAYEDAAPDFCGICIPFAFISIKASS